MSLRSVRVLCVAEGEGCALAEGFGVGGDHFVVALGQDIGQGLGGLLGAEVASFWEIGEPEGGFGVFF